MPKHLHRGRVAILSPCRLQSSLKPVANGPDSDKMEALPDPSWVPDCSSGSEAHSAEFKWPQTAGRGDSGGCLLPPTSFREKGL
jgi:hypothetical protein